MKNNKKRIGIIGIELIIFGSILIVFFCVNCCKSKEEIIIPYIEKQPIENVTIPEIEYVDTIPIRYINQDSIERAQFIIERAQLIKDSIAFRKACKAINGGYNGFKQRYNNWLRIRKVLNKEI